MDHLEAIVEIKKVISDEFIDKIIPLADKKAKKNLEVILALDKNVKKCKRLSFKF